MKKKSVILFLMSLLMSFFIGINESNKTNAVEVAAAESEATIVEKDVVTKFNSQFYHSGISNYFSGEVVNQDAKLGIESNSSKQVWTSEGVIFTHEDANSNIYTTEGETLTCNQDSKLTIALDESSYKIKTIKFYVPARTEMDDNGYPKMPYNMVLEEILSEQYGSNLQMDCSAENDRHYNTFYYLKCDFEQLGINEISFTCTDELKFDAIVVCFDAEPLHITSTSEKNTIYALTTIQSSWDIMLEEEYEYEVVNSYNPNPLVLILKVFDDSYDYWSSIKWHISDEDLISVSCDYLLIDRAYNVNVRLNSNIESNFREGSATIYAYIDNNDGTIIKSKETTITVKRAQKLSKPTNVKYDTLSGDLTWNSVKNADYYTLNVYYRVTTTPFYIVKNQKIENNFYNIGLLGVRNAYYVELVAHSNDDAFLLSDSATYNFAVTQGDIFKRTSTTQVALSFSFKNEADYAMSNYTLVKSTSDLKIGDKFILVSGNYAMTNNTVSQGKGSVAITKEDGKIYAHKNSNEIEVLTLESGSTSASYSFKTTAGEYLTSNTVAPGLSESRFVDSSASWTISFTTDGLATINTLMIYDTYIYIRFTSNANNSCFTSTRAGLGNSVYIYKLVDGSAKIKDFENVSMNFRYSATNLTNSTINETGLIISQNNLLKNTTLTDTQIFTQYQSTANTKIVKNENKLTTFTLGLNNIPVASFYTEITAVGYVKVGNTYYFNEAKTFSVVSILQAYAKLDSEVTLDGTTFAISDMAKGFLATI